jgi:5-methylcytosine-specific restriction enzyme A
MDASEATEFVLAELVKAKNEKFAGHSLADFIRHDWSDAVSVLVEGDGYLLKGSPGMTQWADSVWLGVYDRNVTTSAQQGIYVAFLVASDGSVCHLSLVQAISEARREAGRGARDLLRATARRDERLLGRKRLKGLETGPVDLNIRTGSRSRDYQDSVIASLPLARGSIPSLGGLEESLQRLLAVYADLVELRDELAADDAAPRPHAPLGGRERIEARRYRWHRRAERSQDLPRLAKEHHGWACQVEACGKTLADVYGEEHHEPYIEAHHLEPFSALRGRPTELDPEKDFAVVCPDCHRMLHQRKGSPYTLEELSAHIGRSPNAAPTTAR